MSKSDFLLAPQLSAVRLQRRKRLSGSKACYTLRLSLVSFNSRTIF